MRERERGRRRRKGCMEGERGLARIEGERVRNIGWWPPVCAVETTTTSTTTTATVTVWELLSVSVSVTVTVSMTKLISASKIIDWTQLRHSAFRVLKNYAHYADTLINRKVSH